jgi:tetratricopeptide (TPR) repeat protein
LKQQQEAQAKQSKEVNTVKALNEKLLAAKAASDAGDFDGAIAILTEANQVDATRDLVWFKLGDAYRLSAPKQTDTAEKQKRFGAAADSYSKAIELKQDAIKSGKDKDPNATRNLAAYYNNMADAYNRAGRIDDAVKTYELAAQADPSSVAQSYFNIGAVLTNAGKVDDAVVAFDKCIAADPTRAEAYYQKGVNLLGKATLQGDKMVAAPGTAEAFQKYLELQPTGGHSEEAKPCWRPSGLRWKPASTRRRLRTNSETQEAVHALLEGGRTGCPFYFGESAARLLREMYLLALALRGAARYS